MHPLLERLRNHWLTQGVEVNGGASEEEVAAFERAHGVALPPMFREYVRELNGMLSDGDRDWVFFWPFSRMRRVSDLNYVGGEELALQCAFADYMIASHDYAIALGPDPHAPAPIWVPAYKIVAASFEEFLLRYLDGDEELICLTEPTST